MRLIKRAVTTARSATREAQFHLSRFVLPVFGKNILSCPVCGGKFRTMKPFSGTYSLRGVPVDHYTENSICPRCHSLMRHRFMVAYMRQTTDVLNGPRRVLHFAPEPGIAALLRKMGADYVAADIDPSLFAGAILADITDIPFPANDFDVTICMQVLNVIADDRKAIRELHRILRPGGHAFITVPIYGETTDEDLTLDAAARLSRYGLSQHCRMYGLDFADKLRAEGFGVRVVTLDDVKGNYFDRSVRSPHIESDYYLFDCTK